MNRLRAFGAIAALLCGCSAAGDYEPSATSDGGAGGSGGTDAAPPVLAPGADGIATRPFGGFVYGAFLGDRLAPTKPVDMYYLYEGRPAAVAGAPAAFWSADYKAMEMLGKYHGYLDASWCQLGTLTVATAGIDCCSPDTPVRWWHGFEAATAGAGGMGGNGGNGGGGGSGGATLVPIASCNHTPNTWRVADSLATMGLRGLHIGRMLTAKELSTEIVNGRPVLARSQGGSLGEGALLLIAGWSPIDGGGDRFLVVREGGGWHWLAYLDIVEHREDWLKNWTDSWYRISTSSNGCVGRFDPLCGL